MKTKIPPPILLLTTGVIMWFVAHSGFAFSVTVPYPLVLSLSLAAIGILIGVLATLQFRTAETTVNPLKPESATSLVRTGIFSRSRNPMYVGLLFILAGWALWLGSLSNLVVIALFIPLITALQIKPEEEALRRLFGEQYESYCREVGRWI